MENLSSGRWRLGKTNPSVLWALACLLIAVDGAHPPHDDTPVHKPLFPLDAHDFTTLALATLGLIVAAGGVYLLRVEHRVPTPPTFVDLDASRMVRPSSALPSRLCAY